MESFSKSVVVETQKEAVKEGVGVATVVKAEVVEATALVVVAVVAGHGVLSCRVTSPIFLVLCFLKALHFGTNHVSNFSVGVFRVHARNHSVSNSLSHFFKFTKAAFRAFPFVLVALFHFAFRGGVRGGWGGGGGWRVITFEVIILSIFCPVKFTSAALACVFEVPEPR